MLFSFDDSVVLAAAGDKIFARGKAYFRDGAVGDIDVIRHRYHATVIGTEAYQVSLGWDLTLDGDCDCPAAEDGFCKHQVALALAVLALAHPPGTASSNTAAHQATTARGRRGAATSTAATAAQTLPEPADDEVLVTRWLSGFSQAKLVELLISRAAQDRDEWRALVARAKAALAPAGAQRDAIKHVIGSPRFMDWRRTHQYARRLEALFDIFDGSAAGNPAEALSLRLYALKKLLSIYVKVDDSSGVLGEIGHRVGQCVLTLAQTFVTPVPALAKDVFAVMTIDDWSTLQPLSALCPALGPKGMASLQTMAEKRLAALPIPKARWDLEASDYRQAQRLLEYVLEACGDLEALIALKQRTLVSGYDYLTLAELCLAHGRTRQGIEWLERGIKHAPDDFRLHDRLAEVYVAEGFPQDAIVLLTAAFKHQRTRERYAVLRNVALAVGDWPVLRKQIDADIIKDKRGSAEARLALRIELKLVDQDDEGAWALAKGQQLPLHVWRNVLPSLERTRPQEAVRVLKTLIDADLEMTYSSRYGDVVKQMKQMVNIARVHPELAETVETHLAGYRSKHARKTKLIAMMAELSTAAVTRKPSSKTARTR